VWAGLLTGPAAWLALLQVNYVLAYVACETSATWFMHLAIGVALALAAAGGFAAWMASPGGLRADDAETLPSTEAMRIQRARWMSLGGVVLSVWFFVVILSMEVPLVVLRACQ
jgi:hypothetical protein